MAATAGDEKRAEAAGEAPARPAAPAAIESRIRYADEEAVLSPLASPRGPEIQRTWTRRSSNASSFRSTASGGQRRRRRSVDPAITLPIEYRTLSLHITDTHERQRTDAQVVHATNQAAEELAGLDWHSVSTTEIFKRFDTDTASGLSTQEVDLRLKKYGRNALPSPPNQWVRKVFWYFFGGFGPLLSIGGILVMLSWKPLGEPNPAVANLGLGIVLFLVFGIQAAFNAWQDFSSSRVMASITSMLPENCIVVRNGTQAETLAPNIVPGDIVQIKAGNKLPADVRLVEVSADAKFDRSILTGESLPIAGTVDATDENYLETKNIGLQGTHCISGTAIGVVVSTGAETIFGRIAKLTTTPKATETTLQKEISRFVLIIVSLMVFFIVLVLIVWGAYLHQKYPDYINVPTLIVSLVSVGIAFVPEGLPIALTTSLTIVANKMRRNDVLCKSLKTVETLGTVSVVCSDKTGTLTKNLMRATHCSIAESGATVAEAKDEANKSTPLGRAYLQLQALGALCNAGEFDASTANAPLEERIIHGDATDQAVLRFSESLGSVSDTRYAWRRRFEIPFNSKNKFLVRIFSPVNAEAVKPVLGSSSDFDSAQDHMLLTIKGAPDVLLPRCEQLLCSDGSVCLLDTNIIRQIEQLKDSWSGQGKRVILLARKILRTQEISISPDDGAFESEAMEQARSDLTLVGMIAIEDPPRDEIPEVVKTLRTAGIRIFMVTGDFQLTAQAIARECGIVSNPPEKVATVSALDRNAEISSADEKRMAREGNARGGDGMVKSLVISGPELLRLNDKQWAQLCTYDEIVFARTTPEQKLRIVNELQARDNVVGMTGDGVNDAPSLKAADIGIALGSGSDIAIEAADMVLLDSFAGIVVAVEHGRLVYDNLKKTIAYLLPAGSFSEFWPVLTNIIFGLPQILSSFLMIIICCFTDCAAAITLAFEKGEADVMLRPPRNPKTEHLVDRKLLLQAYGLVGMIETISSFAMAYWYCQRQGLPFTLLWFGYGNLGDHTQDEVNDILATASSVYFVNLVVMQWFNLLALRTRRLSLFQHPPLGNRATQNWYLFPAILFAVVIIFLFNYIPQLNVTLSTSPVPVENFFLPMAFGLVLLLIDEFRKFIVRTRPKSFIARIAW